MPEIRYTFTATGANSVVQAFNSIESAANKASRVAKDAGRKIESSTSGSGTGSGAKSAIESRVSSQKRLRKKLRRERKKALMEMKSDHQTEMQQLRTQLNQKIRQLKEASQREAAAIRSSQERISRSRRRALRRAAYYTGRGLLQATGYAATAAAGLVGAAGREGVALQAQGQRLAIKGQVGVSGAKRITGASLVQQSRDIASGTPGVSASGVMEGMGAFVQKVGRVDIAKDFAQLMATLSMASGAEIRDIGSSMADMFDKFDVKSVEEMSDVMATLNIQGKKGAFELSDMAKQLPRIAAAGKAFGLRGSEGAKTIGGVLQLIRKGAGTGAQAGTAAVNLMEEMTMKRGKIEQVTGRKVSSDIVENIVSITQATGGQAAGLDEFKFQKRARRALNPFVSMFGDFKKETGSAAEATKMLRNAIKDAVRAQGAEAEMKADAKRASQTTQAQQKALWNSVSNEINASVLPAFSGLIGSLSNVQKSTGLFSALGQKTAQVIQGLGMLAEFLGSRFKKDGPSSLEKTKAGIELHSARGEIPGLIDALKQARKTKDKDKIQKAEEALASAQGREAKAEKVLGIEESTPMLSSQDFVKKAATLYVKDALSQRDDLDGDSPLATGRRKAFIRDKWREGLNVSKGMLESIKTGEYKDPGTMRKLLMDQDLLGKHGEAGVVAGAFGMVSEKNRGYFQNAELTPAGAGNMMKLISQIMETRTVAESGRGDLGQNARKLLGGLDGLGVAVVKYAGAINLAASSIKPSGSVAPGAKKLNGNP